MRKSPPMTLDEQAAYDIREMLLGKFPEWHEDGISAFAPTGEKYITFSCGGPRDEGEIAGCIAFSPKAAWQALKAQILLYMQGRTGILYWRRHPEIGESVIYEDNSFMPGEPGYSPRTIYQVYCRLLISDKQPMTSVPIPSETAEEAA